MPALYINPTVNGKVVEPLEVVGAVTELFSVFTQVMVCATAEASRILTIINWPSTALVVVIVIVRVAALLLVTVLRREVIGTVAALLEAAMALLVVTICEKVCVPVKVWAASVRAIVADVLGNVIVVESVPASVMLLLTVKVLPSVPAKVRELLTVKTLALVTTNP